MKNKEGDMLVFFLKKLLIQLITKIKINKKLENYRKIQKSNSTKS